MMENDAIRTRLSKAFPHGTAWFAGLLVVLALVLRLAGGGLLAVGVVCLAGVFADRVVEEVEETVIEKSGGAVGRLAEVMIARYEAQLVELLTQFAEDPSTEAEVRVKISVIRVRLATLKAAMEAPDAQD